MEADKVSPVRDTLVYQCVQDFRGLYMVRSHDLVRETIALVEALA
jgi:hypothetical protein